MMATAAAPQSVLPIADPESAGLHSANILAFLEAVQAKNLELHSLVLLRHGKRAAEGWWRPYRREDPHLLYSLSKSFASTAIGFAVHEGLIDLDAPILDYFPEDEPANPPANLRAMKVRHLLSMSTGQETEPDVPRWEGGWVRRFLEHPVPFEPGTHFLYNSIATFMLSAILQKVAGMDLLGYLRPRLLDPLGIEGESWQRNPDGIIIGGWGMSVPTEAIARFGQLYLKDGIWDGRQILPPGWASLASKAHVSNGDNPNSDWNQGYGFQFWRCRHNAYRGDGAFGQYCVIAPDQNMVVAITACVEDMQVVMDLIFEHLIGPAAAGALPSDPSAAAKLSEALSNLSLSGPKGSASPDPALQISGARFADGENSASLLFEPNLCIFSMVCPKGPDEVRIGLDDWVHGRNHICYEHPQNVACKGAWIDPRAFRFRIQFTREPGSWECNAKFGGDTLEISTTRRGWFAPTEGPSFKLKRSASSAS